MATAIGIIGLLMLGTMKIRKWVILMSVVGAIALLLRPGVWETIYGLGNSTLDPTSHRGKSYNYRWELWKVAFHEISKSPARFLFGHGGQTTDFMDLADMFDFGGGTRKTGFTSWDSQYASDLMEFGVIGLLARIALYTQIMMALLKRWVRSGQEYRNLAAGIFLGVSLYLFAQTNVAMFSPQLNYLFWALVAIGSKLGKIIDTQDELCSPGETENIGIYGVANKAPAIAG